MEPIKLKLNTTMERISNFTSNARKTAKEKRTEGFLTARAVLLENYWKTYQTLHDELTQIASAQERSEDPYFAKDMFSNVECAYIETLTWLNDEINELRPHTTLQNNPGMLNANQNEQLSTQVRLPKINLPTFTGSYIDWQSFRDTYVSLIHENTTLSNIQKMHYLKSAITGDAAKLLKHLSVSSANYGAAWNILSSRFENMRLLVNANLNTLLSLPSMSAESSSEIRRVLDNFTQAVRALENLKRPVGHWNDWLTYLLANKLDQSTRKDWEMTISTTTEIPSFESLKTFLEGRLHTLDAIKRTSGTESKSTQQRVSKPTVRSHHASSTTKKCINCPDKHILLFCPKFRAQSTSERVEFVQRNKLCFNCLKPNHTIYDCPSINRCKHCSGKHHSMLHRDQSISSEVQTKGHAASVSDDKPSCSAPKHSTASGMASTNTYFSHKIVPSNTVLLATANVIVQSPSGRTVRARALFDQGSESSFITTALANSLKLPKRRVRVPVLGIGGCKANIAEAHVKYNIISTTDCEKVFEVHSLVLPSLTHLIPSRPIQKESWPHLEGLQLADPNFNTPAMVELILGADVYSRILMNDICQGPAGSPVAQRTAMGWILSGCVAQNADNRQTLSFHCTADNDLHTLMKRFWEVESISEVKHRTPDEEYCEQLFQETHRRDATGRYVVRLPTKPSVSELGESRQAALSALTRMERRFSQDSQLHVMYTSFMDEFLKLHHMELVPNEEHKDADKNYYLPHHAVFKPSSSTTKLRVVFNASQKTSTGLSLNQVLHVGPKLQNDVSEVIMKWRMYPFVFCGDIEKMYRQIRVDPQDTNLQRILWRTDPTSPIQCFRLLTVTYGTASAPYLATKTLHQLANDNDSEFPLAASLLRENFYVDDALFGSFDQKSAIQARDELRLLLSRGGFKLRKWLSNCPEMLADLPDEDKEISSTKCMMHDDQFKALGIMWSPLHDHFTFRLQLGEALSTTKRQVLSDISRLYDPLGWLSPVTIKAKIFMQKLWMSGCNWDDELRPNMLTEWLDYRNELKSLADISVDRWNGVTGIDCAVELHGFSDASELAYGAAVYLRILHDVDNAQMSLIAAKTRVSPLKTISLPRLELCGAALLAELMTSVQKSLHLDTVPIHAWTDSTIVLGWLRDHPSRWKVFVANRVSTIQQKLSHATWHHIASGDNPADCMTRGMSPTELKTFKLWWFGPTWLSQHSAHWPNKSPQCNFELIPEKRLQATTHIPTGNFTSSTSCSAYITQNQATVQENDMLCRYSNLRRLLTITAYCRRFIANAKVEKSRRYLGLLTQEEIETSLMVWIKVTQAIFFPAEIASLSSNDILLSRSKLSALNPFLDEQNILRIGGRIKHSLLPFDEKHPIIVPKTSHLTQLLIDYAHTKTVHGGVQLTLHYLRSKYWILHGRSRVRQFVRQCVVCYRFRAKTKTQIMGDLPPDRIRPTKPFLISGVDFAGPFMLTPIKGRGKKVIKTYVAIFICLSTRAIHVELVMDLSSEAFQAAFKRFIARRGRCSRIYSDNATNFVATDKELRSHLRQLSKDCTSSTYQTLLSDGTEWRFIPPSSPHFGGLWEAGVRSLKHHLRRIMRDHILSIEEMLTLLAQVEACLNSRPLHALTDDPNDLSALTPGHFLVGESLISVPAPSLLEVPTNRLNRWQLVQQMKESLWNRWQKEYLHNLQLRNKWRQQEEPIKVNDLVLISDNKLPPTKWALGRVIHVHPGSDGHIRVVTLKHKAGTCVRPITKLCVLPVNTQN